MAYFFGTHGGDSAVRSLENPFRINYKEIKPSTDFSFYTIFITIT